MKCPCIDCADRRPSATTPASRFAEYRRPLDAAIAQRAKAAQVNRTLHDLYQRTHLTVGRMARRCAAARE